MEQEQPKKEDTPAPVAPRQVIVVQSDVDALDTGKFDQMMRVARVLAASSLVPEHLNRVKTIKGEPYEIDRDEAIANCFLVVNQAARWQMDPFGVAQSIFVHKGRIGYEGKLIGAVINAQPELDGRLTYEFFGPAGPDHGVRVSGKIKGDDVPRTVEGTVRSWRTQNESWERIPEQMLCYRGAREWARRWMPDAIYGIVADEEVEIEPRVIGSGSVDPTRSAASRMRDALRESSAPTVSSTSEPAAPASDTDSVPVEGKTAWAVPEKGTSEIHSRFIERLASCGDMDTLGVMFEDTRIYEWTRDQADQLLKTYNRRLKDLRG